LFEELDRLRPLAYRKDRRRIRWPDPAAAATGDEERIPEGD
jgi:hypothetical protein